MRNILAIGYLAIRTHWNHDIMWFFSYKTRLINLTAILTKEILQRLAKPPVNVNGGLCMFSSLLKSTLMTIQCIRCVMKISILQGHFTGTENITWLLRWQRSVSALQWRHNGRGGVSNHRRLDCVPVCSDAYQRKHQSSSLLAYVRGTHRWPVNSPHKRPVTLKMFPFDDVIIRYYGLICQMNPLWGYTPPRVRKFSVWVMN